MSLVLHAELQLAALLGKTLLENNGELEMKLKTLQDFAEETLIAKQVSSFFTGTMQYRGLNYVSIQIALLTCEA